MNRFWNILKKTVDLPVPLALLIAIPSFVFMIVMLVQGEDSFLAYLSYVLSAYALTVSVFAVIRIVKWFRRDVRNHPLYRRFRGDILFRTKISLAFSVTINLFYVAVKLLAGIFYKSFWFISMAIYYALLVAIRLSLLSHVYKEQMGEHRIKEEKKARLSGIFLLLIDCALSVIVFFMVYWNRTANYPGFLIYVMAAYSFYAATMALIRLIKYRKYKSPVLSATKILSLSAAMVSILSLETAMLSTFGQNETPFFRRMMTGLTGGGISITVLGLAIYMIVKSTKSIRALRHTGHSPKPTSHP